MPAMSRKDFLRLVAALTGGAIGASALACGLLPQVNPVPVTDTPFPPNSSAAAAGSSGADAGGALQQAASAGANANTNTPSAATQSAPSPSPTRNTAYLAVAHGGNDPAVLVRRAVEAIGGIGLFVPSGASVVIKPNICNAERSFEYASTTNPWVVSTLVTMCLEAGAASVRVMDYPFDGSAADAYVSSGIQEQVEAAGGSMIPISYRKFISQKLPKAALLKSAFLYEDAMKADVLINVPIAKNHSSTTLTLGMKNLMGIINDHDRQLIHNSGFSAPLTDLAAYVKPALTVVDAVRILMHNGPTGGSKNDVKEMDTVIASADIVAADAYATTLFGMDAMRNIPYIKYAADHGLGRADLSSINKEDIPVGA